MFVTYFVSGLHNSFLARFHVDGWLLLMKFFKQNDWIGQLGLKNCGISNHCGS
jgi:hypothetical protein